MKSSMLGKYASIYSLSILLLVRLLKRLCKGLSDQRSVNDYEFERNATIQALSRYSATTRSRFRHQVQLLITIAPSRMVYLCTYDETTVRTTRSLKIQEMFRVMLDDHLQMIKHAAEWLEDVWKEVLGIGAYTAKTHVSK